MESIVSRDTYF